MASSAHMHLTISTVDIQLFRGDIYSVTVPGTEGELTILSGHEALITLLKPGTITVRVGEHDSNPQTFTIEGGALETSQGEITILV